MADSEVRMTLLDIEEHKELLLAAEELTSDETFADALHITTLTHAGRIHGQVVDAVKLKRVRAAVQAIADKLLPRA